MDIDNLVSNEVEEAENVKEESGASTADETQNEEPVGNGGEEEKKHSWTTSLPQEFREEAKAFANVKSYLKHLRENQKPAKESEDVWQQAYSNIVPENNRVIDSLFKKAKDSGVTTEQTTAILSGVQELLKAEQVASIESLKAKGNELIKEEGITGQKGVEFKNKLQYLKDKHPDLYQDAYESGILYHPFVLSLVNNDMANVQEGKLIRGQSKPKPKTLKEQLWDLYKDT